MELREIPEYGNRRKLRESSPESSNHPNSAITLRELREKSKEVGFDDVGLCKPEIPPPDIKAYRAWIGAGYQGPLSYMEKDIRCFPRQIFPEAKTAIIFLSYYKQKPAPFISGRGVIASFARGRNYHNLHRGRLKKIIRWLEERTGKKKIARGFSDSFPIMERALAVRAGLGWFGKNTLLINPKFGTFTLLAGILTSLDLPKNDRAERVPRCGKCSRCIDACPVQALVPYRLDAGRCLSTHLIESREELPEEILKRNPGYIFGCDLCQEACPHNRLKPPAKESSFLPQNGPGEYLTGEKMESFLRCPQKLYGTALQRRGVMGLVANGKKIFDNL